MPPPLIVIDFYVHCRTKMLLNIQIAKKNLKFNVDPHRLQRFNIRTTVSADYFLAAIRLPVATASGNKHCLFNNTGTGILYPSCSTGSRLLQTLLTVVLQKKRQPEQEAWKSLYRKTDCRSLTRAVRPIYPANRYGQLPACIEPGKKTKAVPNWLFWLYLSQLAKARCKKNYCHDHTTQRSRRQRFFLPEC